MIATKEQRGTRRKLLETEVVLHFARHGAVRVKTRDISYGGMRLAVKPPVLNPNSKVKVTLIVREAAEVIQRTVDAWVIHMNQTGCGIKFDGIDRHTFRLLQTLMRLAPPAAAS